MRFLLWIFLPMLSAHAQDLVSNARALQRDLKKSELSVAGSVQSQMNVYSANGASVNSVQQGQLVLRYANRLSVPIQFYFTNAQFSTAYQLPALRPQKQLGTAIALTSCTLLAGYRSLSFSSHALQGVPFYGGGAIYQAPKQKIKFTAAGGSFLVATAPAATPPFKRYGVVSQLRLGSDQLYVALLVCKWKDVLYASTNTLSLLPAENLVLGTSGAYAFKTWRFSGDYCQSIYTHNLLQGIQRRQSFTYFNEYVDPRPSTRVYHHLQLQADYQAPHASHHLEAQRTDDGYTSMGAPWVLSDVLRAQYQSQFTHPTKEQSLQAEVAFLKNNLRRLQAATLLQGSGGVSLHLRLHEQWSLQVQQQTVLNHQQQAHQWQGTTNAKLSYAHRSANAVVQLAWQEQLQTNQGPLLLQHQCSFSSQRLKHHWQWQGHYQLVHIVLHQQHRFSHSAAFTLAHTALQQKLKWQSTLATRLQPHQPFFTETLFVQYHLTKKQVAALQTVLQTQARAHSLSYQLTLTYRWLFSVKTSHS